MTAKQVANELKQHRNPAKIEVFQRFFKTKKGEYGYGDKFWGLKVPIQRQIAKKYQNLKLVEIKKLLQSPIHEQRLTGLLILTYRFPKSSTKEQQKIFDFYLKNRKAANNWDLIDASVPKIIGQFLLTNSDREKEVFSLIKSKNLWDRRLAVLATATFIGAGRLKKPITLFQKTLNDPHDLIHKAVGWMLREVGKKDQAVLKKFLDKNVLKMPRTMLRYSIERLPEKKRLSYLKMKPKTRT